MNTPARRKTICVAIDTSTHYGRAALLGVARFARAHPAWSFQVHPRWPVVWRGDIERFAGHGVIAQVYEPDLSRQLASLPVPVVNISSILGGLPFPQVIPDNAAAGELGASHLIEMNHRSFGYVGFPGHQYSSQVGRGFVTALRRAGHACRIYRLDRRKVREFSWERERRELGGFLARLPRPAAVMACNDVRARHVIEICQHEGLRVPEDVAVVGFGNDDLTCSFVDPSLTSVAVAAERIGHAAAALLDDLMRRTRPRPASILRLPPTRVIVRRSSDLLAVEDEDVADAIRFIRNHADQPITVADVLRQVPLSRRMLERRFLDQLGHAPGEEIRRAHIQRARTLLLDTDMPMSAVARSAGFTSAARLNEAFRARLGTSPTRFRAAHRAPVRPHRLILSSHDGG